MAEDQTTSTETTFYRDHKVLFRVRPERAGMPDILRNGEWFIYRDTWDFLHTAGAISRVEAQELAGDADLDAAAQYD